MKNLPNKWQFWIDRGGTFTDIVAITPDGAVKTGKYLSENPEAYPDAALFGIRNLMGLSTTDTIPADKVDSIKMGTTVATNALLEHKGEPTLLLTNRGFRDALLIGDQKRPRLFDLGIIRPEQLYARVEEVAGRMGARGDVITPFDDEQCRATLKKAYADGLRSIAIVFMHGYRFPDHEDRAAQMARDIGFGQVTTSHGAAPLMKLIPRGETAVADAYLSPILRRYVDRVSADVGDIPLYFMQSNGGLAKAAHFEGKDAILSGPAGGIVGAVAAAKAQGISHIIGFDMGGTSTDVSHYKGHFERADETTVAGVRLKVPMLDIHTVAAGGGSICFIDGGRARVGPESAGANPGPAAYGRGGPLTVTDCNLMTGRIQPDHFPHVFGANSDQPLNTEATKAAFGAMVKDHAPDKTPEELAEGFLFVAVEHMARAIKKISVERGHDLSRYALMSFGGAGGQFACRVADALAIEKVLIHPLSGVLSAYGIGLADLRHINEKTIELPLSPENMDVTQTRVNELQAEAAAALTAQGVPQPNMLLELAIKYQGSDSTIRVPMGNIDDVRDAFLAAHQRQFGFVEPDKAMIIELASAEAFGGGGSAVNLASSAEGGASNLGTRPMFCGGQWLDAPLYDREHMIEGQAIHGPAIIVEGLGTNVVETGWSVCRTAQNNLLFTRAEQAISQNIAAECDPILLEVFNNRFMNIAEEMGAILEKTAHSVNMKERLDFSCALFDRDGNLVANAPHMPVHLGSMSDSVLTIARRNAPTMKAGDVYMLNDPYHGGTHLPDVTVVAPVFMEGDTTPSYFVASRGHHADIGGISPGSMPAFSTSIAEEGVVFDNLLIQRDGVFRQQSVLDQLNAGPYPARNPSQNIADLKAQMASTARGVTLIHAMVAEFGKAVVDAYMGFVQDNAEAAVKAIIPDIAPASIRYALDNGCHIQLSVTPHEGGVRVDFTGTSAQMANNFNAPRSITTAAALYVFRTMVGDDIPLNAGCLRPITLVVPEGCFLNPTPPAAVVAGNVETSQAVTNALLLAMGKLAASQGTMNNFTFGNDQYQYYETIAGGSGAGDGFNGADAFQVHMTNSRLTDPEVLEWRYPVVLEEFSIRQGSGGKGQWSGGNGVVRKVRFNENMDMSLLSSHRNVPPLGLKGGDDGLCGENTVIDRDGIVHALEGCDRYDMKAGDLIIIKTPGGGGYGEK